MTDVRSFVLSGVMAATPQRGALLALASALHRRGVDVVEAELERPRRGVRAFNVTFNGTPRQAETVLRTVDNQVYVLEVSLYVHVDARTAC